MDNKKKWAIILAVIIVLIIVVVWSGNTSKNSKDLTVGAVVSLTGPAAVWGESFKNGAEMALEGKTGIKVLFEDSKGVPADGISAFDRLQMQKVDISVSILSAVSATLSKTASERKLPLLASMTTADGIANDYTVRYFNNVNMYAEPAFTAPISPVIKAKKIAFIYRTDELGVSTLRRVKELSAQYEKDLVFTDTFKPNESDFLTILSKVKASGAEVLLFTDATPVEGVGILKKATQLKLNIPIVEASGVFGDLSNRKQVEGIPFYSTAFDFVYIDKSMDFKTKYLAKYGKEANYGAAFGYDSINLLYQCKDQKDAVLKCLRNMKQITGVSGTANQVAPGDFVVSMHLEKVN
jgi:branched-chain amino acid transport system substrate-binding protein